MVSTYHKGTIYIQEAMDILYVGEPEAEGMVYAMELLLSQFTYMIYMPETGLSDLQ